MWDCFWRKWGAVGTWKQRSDQNLVSELTEEWRVRDWRRSCLQGSFHPQEKKDQGPVRGHDEGGPLEAESICDTSLDLGDAEWGSISHSVVFYSLRFHGVWPARLLWPLCSSRQEYWSGLAFPSSGDLPDPGIKPGSPALQAHSLPSEPPGEPMKSEGWDQIFCAFCLDDRDS